MTTALADRTSRPAASPLDARPRPTRSTVVRRPATGAGSLSGAARPPSAATAADVMAVLAAFGLED